MLNSLLILGSTNKKFRKGNYVFAILWIGYMILNSNLTSGLVFVVANLLAFSTVFVIGKILKGKYSNTLVSIFSILIWSVLIDTICYFMYPQMIMGQNIVSYIGNGILFNYKNVLINTFVVCAMKIFEMYRIKIKEKQLAKEEIKIA